MTEPNDHPTERILRHGREVRDGSRAAASAAGHLVGDLGELAQSELETRPYVTLGVALGTGLLLGGGLPPKLVAGAAGFGLRVAVARLVRRVAREAAAGSGDR